MKGAYAPFQSQLTLFQRIYDGVQKAIPTNTQHKRTYALKKYTQYANY